MSDDQIILVKFSGKVEWTELLTAFPESLILIKEKNSHLLLVDYIDAFINFSIFQIFDTPEKLELIAQKHGIDFQLLKRAICFNPETFKNARFIETVSINQGQYAGFFHNQTDAIKWLTVRY